MKTFISLSGGVESTSLCLLYGKGATAIWCDPGAEHNEMLERMQLLGDRFKEIHGGDFELVILKPTVRVKGVDVQTLEEHIRIAEFMPSAQARYCTGDFKIEPIDKYLAQQGECEMLIGLNADEEPGEVRTGNWMKVATVNYRYPLYEDGYTREDCESLLRANGLHPEFPIYMSRGGCIFCFYKSPFEYKAMYLLDRPTFERVRTLEHDLQKNKKKAYSIVKTWPMDKIAHTVEQEVALWGREAVIEMYRPLAVTKVCGAFCHR